MFYNLRDKVRRWKFDTACRGIYSLKPLKLCSESEVAVLTLLQSKDLVMYLYALRSFVDRVPIGKVFVVNDGTLTFNDVDRLKFFVPKIEILSKDDFQSKHCPTGGCWERLLAIAELSKDYYIIQLDGDTLTINALDEVVDCIESGFAFTLGTMPDQRMKEMIAHSEKAKGALSQSNHIQTLSEANFSKLRNHSSLKYVRGCAGFVGFPHKGLDKSFIENLSSEMGLILGSRWTEWGTEQVMSNIAIANIESAIVLPYPKYCSVNVMDESTAFIHFIGSHRFKNGVYQSFAKKYLMEQ